MLVSYRDADEIDTLGYAGYLTLQLAQERSVYQAALFLINVRGEPIEFLYNQIKTPNPFLWRQTDIRRFVERELIASLLLTGTQTPRVMFCLAKEISQDVFRQDLQTAIPVCWIDPVAELAANEHANNRQTQNATESLNLAWYPSTPSEGSKVELLLGELIKRGLLTEPFERASIGLSEVYPGQKHDENE